MYLIENSIMLSIHKYIEKLNGIDTRIRQKREFAFSIFNLVKISKFMRTPQHSYFWQLHVLLFNNNSF